MIDKQRQQGGTAENCRRRAAGWHDAADDQGGEAAVLAGGDVRALGLLGPLRGDHLGAAAREQASKEEHVGGSSARTSGRRGGARPAASAARSRRDAAGVGLGLILCRGFGYAPGPPVHPVPGVRVCARPTGPGPPPAEIGPPPARSSSIPKSSGQLHPAAHGGFTPSQIDLGAPQHRRRHPDSQAAQMDGIRRMDVLLDLSRSWLHARCLAGCFRLSR
jgi:hypothetical protein